MKKLLYCIVTFMFLSFMIDISILHVNAAPIRLGVWDHRLMPQNAVATYTFTPDETTKYAMCLESDDESVFDIEVSDSNKKSVEFKKVFVRKPPEEHDPGGDFDGYTVVKLDLIKDETYTITIKVVGTHSGWSSWHERDIVIQKASSPDAISFASKEYVMYVGDGSRGFHPIIPKPWMVDEKFVWTSSDPDVASIKIDKDFYGPITPHKVGTTTITLTAGSISSSFLLRVEDVKDLPINGKLEFKLTGGATIKCTITPTKTGQYAIYSSRFSCAIHEDGMDSWIGIPNGRVYKLKAGKKYVVDVTGIDEKFDHEQDPLYVYCDEVTDKVNSVSFDVWQPSKIGEKGTIFAITDPIYLADVLGVKWEVEDPSIVKIEKNNGSKNYAEITFLKAGSTKVTATVGNVSCTREVGIAELEDGKKVDVECYDRKAYALFTPKKDGYYSFTFGGASFHNLKIRKSTAASDNDWDHTLVRNDQPYYYYLKAGESYTLYLEGFFDQKPAEPTTIETKLVDATASTVSKINVTSVPSEKYEFGNDHYGHIDNGTNEYLFHPIGYNNFEGFSFDIVYSDGTVRSVTHDMLKWDGDRCCWYGNAKIEFHLIDNNGNPTDQIPVNAPSDIRVKMECLNVITEFTITLADHTHDLKFIDMWFDTNSELTYDAHYECKICSRLFFDKNGNDPINDLNDILIYGFFSDTDIADRLIDSKETLGLSHPSSDRYNGYMLTFSKNSLEMIAKKGIKLHLYWGDFSLTFDQRAIEAINRSSSSGYVTFSVMECNSDQLTADQFRVLDPYGPEKIVSLKVTTDSGNVHELDDAVKVKVPLSVDMNAEYNVLYVKEDGTATRFGLCASSNDWIEFNTTHFSVFAIIKNADLSSFPEEKYENDSDITFDDIELDEALDNGAVLIPNGSETIEMDQDFFNAIADSDREFIFNFDDNVIVNFDPKALSAIKDATGSDGVSINVRELASDELSEGQFRVLSDMGVEKIISVDVFTENAELHEFGGGVVKIAIPFNAVDGQKYDVVYVADDGTVEKMDSVMTDNGIEFTTTHFSVFSIVSNYSDQPSYIYLIGACVLVAIATVVVFVIVKQKKKNAA